MLSRYRASNVIRDSLCYRLTVSANAIRQAVDCLGDSTFHYKVNQSDIAKVGNRSRFARLNVRIDQVAHVGFVSFEIDCLSTRLTNDFPQLHELIITGLAPVSLPGSGGPPAGGGSLGWREAQICIVKHRKSVV